MILIQNSKFKSQLLSLKYNSKFKTFGFIVMLLTFNFYLLTATVSAQSATPSSSLKQKIKDLQTEIASKASQLKKDISQKLQNRAYVGFIKSKNAHSLTLATTTGSKIVNLNEYTIYNGEKVTNLNQLIVDDYVVALGDIDETAVLTAKKVIKLPQSAIGNKKIIAGEITAVDENNLIIRTTQNQTITAIISPTTTISAKRIQLQKRDLKPGYRVVIVVSTPLKTNTQTSNPQARFIYVIATAQGGTNILKEASPSAEASESGKTATPSAKPRR